MTATKVSPDTLNKAIEFDHVFVVRTSAPDEIHEVIGDIHAPCSIDGELDSNNWEYWSTGRSNQYGYQGPIMHSSEQCSGLFAADLLNAPGIYACIADMDTDSKELTGWAIVKLNDFSADWENRAIEYGHRDICRDCGLEIEYVDYWHDRGGNKFCIDTEYASSRLHVPYDLTKGK